MNRLINHIILWALVIVVMAACGGGSDAPTTVSPPTTTPTPTPDPDPTPQPTPEPAEPQQVPIGFKADLSDAVSTTRSAGDGVLDNEGLQAKGFGVYCWYTGSTVFNPAFTDPNTHIKDYAVNELMRNQKVEYVGSQWTYSPSKYWPLNTAELLTFRAYAPYTDYIKTDSHGMPQLPVVVKATDYHEGIQHDPLFGTGKLLQTTGPDAGEYVTETIYGEHYDNITYPMSGTYRLNKTTDPTEGTIHWYFHHGMAMLVFYAKLDENASDTEVEIVSITIGPLYNQGLLDISSPATSSSAKPTWGDRDGNMNVTLYGVDAPDGQDLNVYTIGKEELTLLTSKGLLIIPRSYVEDSELTITVSYKSSGGQINTVTTKLPNEKSEITEYVFEGNTIYTVNLTVGSALIAEIESVNVATMKTNWTNIDGNDHEVYNW